MFSKRLEINKKREWWGAAQEREERLSALAEADPTVPGAMLERRLIGLHAAGPRAPRDAMLPPVCMLAQTGIYNQFIGRCKGGVGDALWGKSWIWHCYGT